MKKIGKWLLIFTLIGTILLCGVVLTDKTQLRGNLIRLHVVANSDAEEDQCVKLKVRNAVLTYLQPELASCKDAKSAKDCIQNRLTQLTEVANGVLEREGSEDRAVVTLMEEAFPIRYYDTFTLPSGVYESLRIVIGSGEGHNWWCVVFPALCVPATSDSFTDEAISAGLSPTLTDTISGEHPYTIRFFLLDCLGKIENFFSEG